LKTFRKNYKTGTTGVVLFTYFVQALEFSAKLKKNIHPRDFFDERFTQKCGKHAQVPG
jgi:hypothetical protein